jgi:hypothetical protein
MILAPASIAPAAASPNEALARQLFDQFDPALALVTPGEQLHDPPFIALATIPTGWYYRSPQLTTRAR